MRQFTAVIVGLILTALLLGLASPTRAAGETTALQAFIDAQAATIAALNTRVAAAEATEVASQKRIAALEAWVKAYVPVASAGTKLPVASCSIIGCATSLPLSLLSRGTATKVVNIGNPSTFVGPLGTAPIGTGPLGTPPNPLSPHP